MRGKASSVVVLLLASFTVLATNSPSSAESLSFHGGRVIDDTLGGAAFITHADLNGDGDPDVLAVGAFSSDVRWYENDGNAPAVFTEHVVGSAQDATSVSTGDIDQDGDIDVVSHLRGAPSEIYWFENDGDGGGWTRRTIAGALGTQFTVFVANVNNDPYPDVVSTGFGNDDVLWFQNPGPGNLHLSWGFTQIFDGSARGLHAVSAGDLDDDGDMDVLSGGSVSGTTTFQWHENDGTPEGPAWATTSFPFTFRDHAPYVMTADVNGDGDLDALAAHLDSGHATWYENNGAADPTFTAHDITSGGARGLDVSDVDGDLDMDVAVADASGSTIEWYDSNGLDVPSWTQRPIATPISSAHGVIAVDLDGDDDTDLASASLGDHKVRWFENFNNQDPVISAQDIAYSEPDGTAEFTLELSAFSESQVSVDYETLAGTALAGQDYTHVEGTAVFPAFTTSATVQVPLLDDANDEPDPESFTLQLTNATNANLGSAPRADIYDDEPIQMTVNDVTTSESADEATFAISLSQETFDVVTVDYATEGGTATEGTDFTATSGTATIPEGSTAVEIDVPNIDDNIDEPSETYTLELSNLGGDGACCGVMTIHDASGTGTIQDDDATPTLTISDPTVTEGTNAGFVVTASDPSPTSITVTGNTANGTAGSGDFTALTSQTFTIAAGETTSNTVNVATTDDNVDEPDGETFTMNLSDVSSNATLDESSGTGTINDNDEAPVLSVNNATVSETDGDQPKLTFTVSAAGTKSTNFSVDVTTGEGTATAGSDYTSISPAQTLTFTPGQTSKTVEVTIANDGLDEPSETLFLNLGNEQGSTISDDQGTGTITDNDATPTLSFTPAEVTLKEGKKSTTTEFVFTVTLTGRSGSDVTVNYATQDGSAKVSNGDYVAETGSLLFESNPSPQTKMITVVVNGDKKVEKTEKFTVLLSSAVNASIVGTNPAVGKIKNDDR